MKNFLLLLIVLILHSLQMQSQNQVDFAGVKAEIFQTIEQLFDGMREGDSAKVHQVFMPEVRMMTTLFDKNGNPALRTGSLERFLEAIGTPHDKIWDERIFNTKIHHEDNLANVWTEFEFYAGGDFSHCGVNDFQLIKEGSQWKIISLIDTRRKDDCPSKRN